MRRIHFILFTVLIALISSCNDFLTMTPRDKKIVRTVEDYRDILASYVKFIKTHNPQQETLFGLGTHRFPKFDVSNLFAVYTGEVKLASSNRYYNAETSNYNELGVSLQTWSYSGESQYIWNRYYLFLGPINMIISDIDNVENTNTDIKNYVKGEALVWRAFAYFKLLQYFAPYKNNEYGVPLFLTPYKDIGNAMPERKTQREVYKQIISDCDQALNLLKQTPTNEWNCAYNAEFIYSMKASIYNYKAMSGAAENSDWLNAEKNAEMAITGRQLAQSTEELAEIFDSSAGAIYKNIKNDEFYIRLVSGDEQTSFLNFIETYYNDYFTSGVVNEDYYTIFLPTDRRKGFYFKGESTPKNDKYNLLKEARPYRQDGGVLMPFRLAEAYLIKCEAAYRQNKIQEAANWLRKFKESRYETVSDMPITPKEILDEILLERTREFYQENDMIWLDMKRLSKGMSRIVNGNYYELKPDDYRYALPIPLEEIKRNKKIVQNPGWEGIVF